MKYLKSIVYQTCIAFTLITIFLFLIAESITSSTFTAAIDLTQLLIILASSAVIGVTNQLLTIHTIPAWLRVAIHYVILTSAFTGVFAGIGKIASEAAGIFVMIIGFTIVYACVMGLGFALKSVFSKKNAPKTQYTKIYDNSKDKK